MKLLFPVNAYIPWIPWIIGQGVDIATIFDSGFY